VCAISSLTSTFAISSPDKFLFIITIQHFYRCRQNARKNIIVTVSVRVSVTVRVSLV